MTIVLIRRGGYRHTLRKNYVKIKGHLQGHQAKEKTSQWNQSCGYLDYGLLNSINFRK